MVAITLPWALVERSAFGVLVMAKEVVVALVRVVVPNIVVPEKVLVPVKVLLLARSVEDAAVMVMFVVPSKEVPLMVRGVWSAVAVPALPELEPVIVEENVLLPEKVLASARSVDDAAVIMMDDPALSVVPLMVPRAPTR